MIRYVLVILAPLLLGLGGCAEFLARAMMDATYLQVTASEYVREVHGLRQFIRQECRASLMREVDKLKLTGDEEALREVLAKSYPGLVTVKLYKTARGDQESVLSRAPGCE